jgi:hypothetical protein
MRAAITAHCHPGSHSVADQLHQVALMYAAHFAAGLAVKGCAPKAPAWALLSAVFIADFVWISLAAIGLEPADPNVYFDEWSHSLLSILFEASLFALLFYRRGPSVWLPIWIATCSHFILDWPIHPSPMALYPHSSLHIGFNLWHWGLSKSWLGRTHYWWIQCVVVLALLAIYIKGSRKSGNPANLIAASAIMVFGLHLIF